MRHALLTFALVLPLLAACQLSLPGRDRPAAAVNPVTAGSITTTALDAVPPASVAAETDTPLPAPDTAEATATPSPDAAPGSDVPPEAQTSAPVDAPAPAQAVPVQSKSPSQIACEEDGGTWARAGPSGGMACVRRTRDGGKACDNKDDCSGECLARSRTCAPIQPLFGCNAVLMDNGAEVNLCID